MGYLEIKRRKRASELLKREAGEWKAIDLSQRPHPDWMTRSFINNRYCVMINDRCHTTHGTAIRVMVQKLDDTPIINHWSEMQNIKNELFGAEVAAVEYFPKTSQLTDDHNIYWMFIYPEGVLPIPL